MKKSIVILCVLCSCTMMEPNLVYISQRADDSFPIETRSSTKIDVTDGFDFSVSLSEAESVAKRIESNSTHWDDMAVDLSSYFVGGSADYVGQLMADVGHQIGMNYGPNGSGAYVTITGFNHYGIYCNSSEYNSSTVVSCLLSNKPVVVVASTTEDCHAWVIDGLHSMVTEYVQTFEWRRLSELNSYNYPIHLYTDEQMAIIDPNVFSGKTVQEVTYYRQYFYKMNWGYDGSGDEVHYGVNDNVWTYVGTNGNYNYQFDKTIWYDFR